MAYCLRTLVHTLEQVLHPHQHHKNWVLDHDKTPQVQTLFEYASFLRDFLDHSPPLIQERIASLEDQIMDAAAKFEDDLEIHITNQILSHPEGQSFTISPPDLGEVMRVFKVAKQEVLKIMDAGQASDKIVESQPVSSSRYPNSKNVVVGVTGDLIQLKSRLTARASKLEIIPIVGMGGTGKTTLARILYDEYSSNKSHFDCCAWATVSQIYDPQAILKTLLECITEKTHQENDDLVVTLHKTLFCRRYLIVLDDIWSCKAWDDVQRAFPKDDNNGSRIILTTRENTVANYVKSNSHEMHLINEDDSWELVRKKVFGEESCPPELEEVGKRIAKNCGGLPLALQVIGGLLSQSQRSQDFWEHVAHNVSSFIAKTDDQFSGIFSWSFAHLPHYLKPCFLYMGAFPEDFEIPATQVIKMWVAEGFMYPIRDKSLEESAEIHLNALVDRNLIFIRKRKSSGKAKTYGIHDLLRDLCLKKAHEKKFLSVRDSKTNNSVKAKSYGIYDLLWDLCLCFKNAHEDDTLNHRRVSVHLSGDVQDEYGSLKLTSLARTFLLTRGGGNKRSDRFMSCLCFKSSLLRVLEVYKSGISEFQEVFLQLVNLRYLAICTISSHIPTRISVLKNLQTLIVNVLTSIAILEDLPQLRHLQFMSLEQISYERYFSVHENLQSLSNIQIDTLTELLGKLPKLRKLEISCDNSNYDVDLTCFQELETLYCWNVLSRDSFNFISKIVFPHSLKKLRLTCCRLRQALFDAIGILPGLQVLKLEFCRFESSDWEPSEGEFCQLQFLEISTGINLENWSATEFHFPVLRHLVLRDCLDLNEIPLEIGGIETLEMIEVDYCKPSVLDSARRILEEQRQFGSTFLQLRLGRAKRKELTILQRLKRFEREDE